MQIKKLRLSKNLTQDALAKKIKVERTTISMWENGHSNPTFATLKKIATVLECSVDDLVS